MSKLFHGTYTALATPFHNGEIDWESLESLVRFQIESGIHGFVINGTTGESPTLDEKEVDQLFRRIKSWAGSQKLILGVGTNSTQSTIANIHRANDLDLDGVLVVVPYYNKPPQRGLVAHFLQAAEASRFPVVLYNVPGRTVQSLSLESIVELAQHPNIVGLKESTGDLEFFQLIANQVPEDFCLLSGDDGSAVAFCLKGGDGVIGVATHLIPQEFGSWIERARNGDESVIVEVEVWKDLIDGIYVEANPIAVKAALQMMGVFRSSELRLPLMSLDERLQEGLRKCLINHNLI